MNKENEFDSIGREFPLQVPAGFFENISERTLRLAKIRENQHHKRKIRLISISVAASVSAIFFLAYLFQVDDIKNDTIPYSMNSPKYLIQPAENPDSLTLITLTEVPDPNQPLDQGSKTPQEQQTDIVPISDLLSQLTDEELHQLSMMYKNDLFISESSQ